MATKSLDYPGDENKLLVSVYTLIGTEGKEAYLQWLRRNWVCLDEKDNGYPIYAKPYSQFDYKYKMKGSLDETEELQNPQRILSHKHYK